MLKQFKELLNTAKHNPKLGGLEIFKYIGPGLLVTVGFIDPGNWASNLAAGAEFGYSLLWMVTLSTIMLIVLQHNVAHLGIASGLCLSEAASEYLKPRYAKGILYSAMLASISTSLAEILGGAIALQMLFNIPILIVHLRTLPRGDRLEYSLARMGYPRFSRRLHGRYHERTRGRGHAPQSIPSLGSHPKPSMEYTG